MDPQNAQFYSIFVAPDILLWKVMDLKDRASDMTEDEIVHAYNEIQYLASSAVSTSTHVKQARRGVASLPAPEGEREFPPTDGLGVDSVEPERTSPKKSKKKQPKKRRAQRQLPPDEKLAMLKERGPLSTCPNPQAKAVRSLRHGKIMSQKEFGEAIGVHPVTVAQYERGVMRVSEYFVDKIATRFPEVDPSTIMNAKDEDFADAIAEEEPTEETPEEQTE